MKLKKFMCDVTSALLMEKNVIFWEYCEKVIISYDGYFAMAIPKSRNIFNHEFSTGRPIPCDWDSHKLKDTTEIKMIGKKIIRIFETDKGEKVQVYEKYLDYFDGDSEFYGNSPKNPVYVRNVFGLCGMIMPIYKE